MLDHKGRRTRPLCIICLKHDAFILKDKILFRRKPVHIEKHTEEICRRCNNIINKVQVYGLQPIQAKTFTKKVWTDRKRLNPL